MDPVATLEWTGSATGIAGAVLLAANTRRSAWAYPVWLVSSVALLGFAIVEGHHGLATQQAVFTAVNLLGVWRWLLQPRAESLGSGTGGRVVFCNRDL